VKNIQHFDAVVIGTGITGLCTALHLARWGRSVALLESQSYPVNATLCSGAGVRFFDPKPQIMEWVHESHAFYQALGAICTPAPALYCLDEDADPQILEEARVRGFHTHTAKGLKAYYPECSWSASALAIADPDAGFYDPRHVRQVILDACRHHQVHIAFAEPVIELQVGTCHQVLTPNGCYSTDHVVFACGYWSAELLKQLGLPIQSRNRTVTVHYLDNAATVPFVVEHCSGFHMRSTVNGGVLFGLPQLDFDVPATQLPDRSETHDTAALKHLRRYLPLLPDQIVGMRTVRSADAWPLTNLASALPHNVHHLAFGQGSSFKYTPAATLAYLDQHLR